MLDHQFSNFPILRYFPVARYIRASSQPLSWKCGEGSSLSPCPSPFPFLLLLLPSLCIFCSLCSDDSAPAPADSPLLQGTGISFTPCLSEPLNWVSCRVCAAVLCGRYVLTPWASVALFSLSECASSLPCGLCWGRCRGALGSALGGRESVVLGPFRTCCSVKAGACWFCSLMTSNAWKVHVSAWEVFYKYLLGG